MKKKPPLSRPVVSDLHPKKHLGQNFLTDQNIAGRIISACHFSKDDVVLEIGAGLGALTHRILPTVKHLIAVETDQRLYEKILNENKSPKLELHHADILEYNFASLPNGLKVIGNLPYYISSPVIGRILENRQHFTHLFITVQWEFGKRMMAKPNTKDYSAFSCFVQYFADVKMLFKIHPSAFKPAPKVQSCFLQLDLYQNLPIQAKNEQTLFTVIRQAFGQRRKTILNSLELVVGREELLKVLSALKIDPRSRAENLTLKDYAAIADLLTLPAFKPVAV